MILLIGAKWFSGNIQAVIYNFGLIFWIATEFGIFLLSRISDKKDRKSSMYDNMSVYGISATNIISCLIVLFGVQYMQVNLPSVVAWVGIILLYFGVVLRIYSVWTLRKFFTVSVEIKTGHELIRKGPYQYLRHPSYSASILSLIGMQIGLRSFAGFLISSALACLAYSYRIHVEEEAMANNFGANYDIYKKETNCIIPFIF